MSKLNPYVLFNGNAREAVMFYQSVFGGEPQISTFGDMHAAQDPAQNDLVMHASLTTPAGYTIMVSDAADRDYQPGNNFSISISGPDEEMEQLKGYFDKLAEGGKVTVALEKAMWGDTFGMLNDKFGISWMFNIGKMA